MIKNSLFCKKNCFLWIFIIITFLVPSIIYSQDGESMNENYFIFTTMNVWMRADPKKGKLGSYEVTKLAFEGEDFIKNCSIEIKTIIAFFTKFYVTEEVSVITKSLGNFSSLSEAREYLLKDKEHYFKDIEIENFYFRSMEIEINNNIVYVYLGATTYKFKIHENNDIEYIK